MNLNFLDVNILSEIGTNFSITSLSEKLNCSNSDTYHSLIKLEKNGFIDNFPYRLTIKGSSYLSTFVICNYYHAAREQRKHEVENGLGTAGTYGFEQVGCYDCNGLNMKCKTYFNTELQKSLQ